MKVLQLRNLLVILLLTISSVSCKSDDSATAINTTFSQDEINNMKFMVEEEKVALDVYDALDQKWGLNVFNNIKQSEQNHFDTMKNLLERYTISYQVSTEKGVFYNADLQKLYTDLIAKGSISIKDALEVGVMIEEKDIKDLEEAIKITNDSYVKSVYTNLLNASYNHLQAFSQNLNNY